LYNIYGFDAKKSQPGIVIQHIPSTRQCMKCI